MTPTGSPLPCFTAPSGLIHYWPGNGNANDLVGNANGTLVNGASFTTGEVGQAFLFNGVDGYVSLPGTFGGTSEQTIDAWIRTDAVTSDFSGDCIADRSRICTSSANFARQR